MKQVQGDRILFFAFILFFLSNFFFAQNKEWKRFVPPGYKMLDTLLGDLNLDDKKDMLLILKDAAEDTIKISEEQRPILILLGQTDGSYYQAGRSNQVVMCKSCGGVMGDPYQRMVISKGYFSVEHYGGSNERWTDIVTFKFDKKSKKWFLYKWGGDNFNVSEPDKKTTLVRTPKEFGIMEFENFRRD
ncbi:MAG TPA: hypothetical protein VNZ49_10205 [Bacteroidia bacterium]|nr:hypothetical protein [Bacteroidia bacterium]